jgi:hypothetical protein
VPTDQGAPEGQEGVVEIGAAFPADAEPAEVVQPGEGALDDPPPAAQPRAVLAAAARDERLDAAAPQRQAVTIVIVAAVGDDPVRTLAGAPALAGDRSDPIDEREEKATSLRLPPMSVARSGTPPASTISARRSTVDRRGSGENAAAKRPEVLASTTPRDQSMRPTAFSRRRSSR